ncbi:MAG: SirA family protein [Clostridiaceae bacterium]|jgi:selenium metabolism protein YedF|nr:SirA family protein [Clostridiaceae bacterium]
MKNIIDCKGLECPQPVINTKKYFDSIDEGSATVIVDNETAKNNVIKFAGSNGYISTIKNDNNLYYIEISKIKSEVLRNSSFKENSLCIVISSSFLGNGDDKLGAILMKSYLYALSESDNLPKDLIFINGGVKLTIEDSDCLDSIKKIHEKGVNILSCGTCLDFYNLKEKLAVGEITNMYSIVEKMDKASNTIKL